MDRRSFLTGLLGAAGAAAIATSLPREARALAGGLPEDLAPRSDLLPPEVETAMEEDEGVEVAQSGTEWRRRRRRGRRRRRRGRRRHYRRHRRYYGRRRRVRRRRWRRSCRGYYDRWGRWRRRCRRIPYWFWLWI